MIALFILLLSVLFCCCIVLSEKQNRNKYCNKNYNRADDIVNLKVDIPTYEVHAVRSVYPKNKGPMMAEYVLLNCYLSGESDVDLQELVLYDEIGKYQIGDVLIFSNVRHEQ